MLETGGFLVSSLLHPWPFGEIEELPSQAQLKRWVFFPLDHLERGKLLGNDFLSGCQGEGKTTPHPTHTLQGATQMALRGSGKRAHACVLTTPSSTHRYTQIHKGASEAWPSSETAFDPGDVNQPEGEKQGKQLSRAQGRQKSRVEVR